MCDYSLDFVASRPAKVGDKLVTTKFKNSVTRGFAAVEEPTVAVCVLPGTEIAFEQEVKYCHSLLPNQKVAGRLARFRQINLEQASVHHDALEFPNGKIIRGAGSPPPSPSSLGAPRVRPSAPCARYCGTRRSRGRSQTQACEYSFAAP